MSAKFKKLGIISVVLLAVLIGAASFFRAPNAQEISKALDATIIDNIDFHGASVAEASSFVMDNFHRQHPEMQKVRLILSASDAGQNHAAHVIPTINGDNARIVVPLQNVPASEAFKFIAGLSGQGYFVRTGRIYLCPYGPGGKLPPLSLRERLVASVEALVERVRGLFH